MDRHDSANSRVKTRKLTLTLARKTVVTMTSAVDGKVYWPAHQLSLGDQVFFTTTGGLPTNITASTPYFAAPIYNDLDHIRLATTLANAKAGVYIDTTAGVQSGVHKGDFGIIDEEERIIWTPAHNEKLVLTRAIVECRTLNGTMTTAPEMWLEANNIQLLTQGVIPVVQGDARLLALLETNIAAQFTDASPLTFKLKVAPVLNTATKLIIDLTLSALEINDVW